MNYIVMVEMILCGVYIWNLVVHNLANNYINVLMLIAYACIKLVIYIVIKRKTTKFLYFVVCVFITICSFIYYPMAIFFPLCIHQLNNNILKKSTSIAWISLLLLFVMPKEAYLLYLIIFSLVSVFMVTYSSLSADIKEKNKKIEQLKTRQVDMENQIDTYNQISESITYQTQLEERNTLSQKLHDELGHTLSGNILRLEAIKTVLSKDVDKSKSLIQEVISNLREGMESIRLILKAAKPEPSTVNMASVQLMIDKIEQQQGAKISLKYNSDVNIITQSMWKIILPNIKEALTNMMKYSSADKCEIEFIRLNKIYKIRIADNGVGCDTITKGLGLIGIEERIALSDGKVIFDSSNGFSITMIFMI